MYTMFTYNGLVSHSAILLSVFRYVSDRNALKYESFLSALLFAFRELSPYLLTIASCGADIFDQHEKMSAIGGRRCESEAPVKRGGGIVFRMNGKRTHPDNIGNLQRAPQGVQKQAGPAATALPIAMDGQARQNEQRYRMTRHPLDNALRCVGAPNLACDNRVVSDNGLVAYTDIGLRRFRLLRLHRMANKESVKFRLAAGEFFNRVSSI